MGQLHEVIAVESTIETTARNILLEAISTFNDRHRFTGGIKKLSMFDAGRENEETEETTEVSTTVDEKLRHVEPYFTNWIDTVLQKESANQLGKADVEVEGTTIIKDAPVCFLLNLEKRLNEFRDVLTALPTLKPGTVWDESQSQRSGVFVARESSVRFKTEKTMDIVVAVEATEHHPAQYEVINRDKPVGKYVDTAFSGAISPARKSRMLEKLDKLIVAVKKARMAANCTQVPNVHCGNNILNFIVQD